MSNYGIHDGRHLKPIEDQNTALAIIFGAVLIGLAVIIAAAIAG